MGTTPTFAKGVRVKIHSSGYEGKEGQITLVHPTHSAKDDNWIEVHVDQENVRLFKKSDLEVKSSMNFAEFCKTL